MKQLSLRLFSAWSARQMYTMASTTDSARLRYQGPNPWMLMSLLWYSDLPMAACP